MGLERIDGDTEPQIFMSLHSSMNLYVGHFHGMRASEMAHATQVACADNVTIEEVKLNKIESYLQRKLAELEMPSEFRQLQELILILKPDMGPRHDRIKALLEFQEGVFHRCSICPPTAVYPIGNLSMYPKVPADQIRFYDHRSNQPGPASKARVYKFLDVKSQPDFKYSKPRTAYDLGLKMEL